MNASQRLLAGLLLGVGLASAQPSSFDPQPYFEKAGDNRAQIAKAWKEVPNAQRAGLAFLLRGMPRRDLQSLDAAFLLENLALAHAVREKVPWGPQIPEERFLNDVLPYANLSEARHPWRRELMELCLPLVADCKTPTEAVQCLNRELFPKVGVKYSTKRRRADQSPKESMESGLASCTGLSILLVNACRAVAVPARVAGIASWVNKRGNHTWVEVWDGGWAFTGAAEPDPKGLDRAWFQADAALARKDEARHAIWAASWRPTPHRFPMAWARGASYVHAVNVTDRYAKERTESGARLMVEVRDARNGERVPARVVAESKGQAGDRRVGRSHGEDADTNDLLTFEVARSGSWQIDASYEGRRVSGEATLSGQDQVILKLVLPDVTRRDPLLAVMKAWFDADPEKRRAPKVTPGMKHALLSDPASVRRLALEAWRTSPRREPLRKDAAKKIVRTADREAPYTLKRVGKKPAAGWPLFIAMHGGGGVPKRINDAQWRHMQIYYREQPDLGGYLYCALRAPNDAWDGFYDAAICPLVIRLIQQLSVTEALDLERVHAMGYSHGGYGAFVIGPKIPDRFASVHASASAPTDGRTRAENLRNLRFTFMVGERDTAYGRADRCQAFDAVLAKLRGKSESDFSTRFDFVRGNGHTGLPDRDMIRKMYRRTRNAAPKRLSWRPSDERLKDFYWLHLPEPKGGQELELALEKDRLKVRTKGVKRISLRLDERLVTPGRRLLVDLGDRVVVHEPKPDLVTLLESVEARGEAGLGGTMRIDLTLEP